MVGEEMVIQSVTGTTRIRFRVNKPNYTARQVLELMNSLKATNPIVAYTATTRVIVRLPECRSVADILEWTGPHYIGQWEEAK